MNKQVAEFMRFVTIMLAIIAANVIRAPIDLAIVLAKRRPRDQIEPCGKPDIPHTGSRA